MARAVLAGAGVALALAGCGGGHARHATRKAHAEPSFSASLSAPTHNPKATTPWRYSIRVTDLHGRRIRAKVRMRVLFNGFPAGKVDNGRTFSFHGTWREPRNAPVIWPVASRGHPLTFEALVSARGQTRKLDYAIRVR